MLSATPRALPATPSRGAAIRGRLERVDEARERVLVVLSTPPTHQALSGCRPLGCPGASSPTRMRRASRGYGTEARSIKLAVTNPPATPMDESTPVGSPTRPRARAASNRAVKSANAAPEEGMASNEALAAGTGETQSGGTSTHVAAPAAAIEMTAALTEFEALRREISDRSAAQTTILNLNLTALAALATLVLANKLDPVTLLVIPLLSACLGMLYFDHATNIDQLGRYIQNNLARTVRRLADNQDIFGYEERVRAHERTFIPRGLSMGVPLLIIFGGVPTGVLIRTWPLLPDGWARALWFAGAIVEGAFVIHWLLFVKRPFADDGSDAAGDPE